MFWSNKKQVKREKKIKQCRNTDFFSGQGTFIRTFTWDFLFFSKGNLVWLGYSRTKTDGVEDMEFPGVSKK